MHNFIIERIADETTPESRMFAIVDWYLTCFHQTKKVNKEYSHFYNLNNQCLRFSFKRMT